jgi:integrase/recombinase XerD
MDTNYSPGPQGLRCPPAEPYLAGFVSSLMGAGYAQRTIQGHLCAAAHLSHWQEHRARSLTELDDASLCEFKRHRCRCQCRRLRQSFHSHVFGARLFVNYLRAAGVLLSPEPELTERTVFTLLREFCEWTRQHRGVTENTLKIYGRIIADALETLGDDPQRFDVAGIRAFVLDRASRIGRSKAKLMVSALRAFLRYLTVQHRCCEGLDTALPVLAGWRRSTLPYYLSAEAIEQVIMGCDPETVAGARDRAVLLLLARLGLRGGEIATLRLGDVDWERATLRVAGKSRRQVQIPLPQDAGDALLHYLDRARPAVESDYVFVRIRAPVVPFANAGAVSDLVKRAIVRAGISTPRYGAHLLRHSAATALLAQGASLDSIGVLLRHRSLETTAGYAKVDVALLRELAQPWPGVVPC